MAFNQRVMKESVGILVQIPLPGLLWGKPGIGKTAFLAGLGGALGIPVETVIASIREPSDFGGLPLINYEDNNTNGVSLEPPAWAYRLAAAGMGILFIDEINTAAPTTQTALMRVMQEGVVGDLALPPNVARLAAANPVEIAAGGFTLEAPLANRIIHLEWDIDVEEWVRGIVSGFDVSLNIPVVPADWRSTHLPQVASLVASYIHHRPDELFRLPDSEAYRGQAWPSPRTWDYVAQVIAACRAAGVSNAHEYVLAAGAVGDGPANGFFSWLDDLDLPDPYESLNHPDKVKIPERSDKLFAFLSSVITVVEQNVEDVDSNKQWLAAWKIVSRIVDETNAPDMGAVAVARIAKYIKNPQYSHLETPTEELKSLLPILSSSEILK